MNTQVIVGDLNIEGSLTQLGLPFTGVTGSTGDTGATGTTGADGVTGALGAIPFLTTTLDI